MNKGGSPSPANRSPQLGVAPGTRGARRRTVQFPEVSNRDAGMYRLLYIGQNSNNVQSVLGMSQPFGLLKNDSD